MEFTIPFLNQVASAGLLGVLLVLSLVANWFFITVILKLNDKRVEDAKELATKVLDPINTTKANSETLISLFQRFLSGNGKTP